MKEATQQKIQRQAELFMDSGEHVQAATNGSSSPWAYWLLGAVTYLGVGRAVLVTDKKVYVCKRTAAGLGSVIARYPRDSVKLALQAPAAARRSGPDDLRPARTDQGRTRGRSGREGALTARRSIGVSSWQRPAAVQHRSTATAPHNHQLVQP